MTQEKENPYLVLAYYLFTEVPNPEAEVAAHKEFLGNKDATGRVYISHEGINGQMSAFVDDAEDYMTWMRNHPLFHSVVFKVDRWHENCFPRMTVKFRRQLVALDRAVDRDQGGRHVSPAAWKAMLEDDEDRLLLDIRNDYEWDIGHFVGAERPSCTTFREFDAFTDQLVEKGTPLDKPVMMCCTGGIRCELYSALMKEKGFQNVVQLEGGIINYGKKEGSAHWRGKLFVFDDRLVVPISEEKTEVVGHCHFCEKPDDAYYNCANMDCNALFICCSTCLAEKEGCCCEACIATPRVRPVSHQQRHKPFRRGAFAL